MPATVIAERILATRAPKTWRNRRGGGIERDVECRVAVLRVNARVMAASMLGPRAMASRVRVIRLCLRHAGLLRVIPREHAASLVSNMTETGMLARRRHRHEHGGLRRLPGDDDQSGRAAVTESENLPGASTVPSAVPIMSVV